MGKLAVPLRLHLSRKTKKFSGGAASGGAATAKAALPTPLKRFTKPLGKSGVSTWAPTSLVFAVGRRETVILWRVSLAVGVGALMVAPGLQAGSALFGSGEVQTVGSPTRAAVDGVPVGFGLAMGSQHGSRVGPAQSALQVGPSRVGAPSAVGVEPLSGGEPDEADSAWAGFVYCSGGLGSSPPYCSGSGNVKGVSGCWNVPAVMNPGVSGDVRAATWIGIGGLDSAVDDDLIQVGTEELPGGSDYAYAETNPNDAHTIDHLFSVGSGDKVCATIAFLGLFPADSHQVWYIFIQDETNGDSQDVATFPYEILVCGDGPPWELYSVLCSPSEFGSAEWIMETPKLSSTGVYSSMPVFTEFGFSNLAVYTPQVWSSAQSITNHLNSEDLYLQSTVGSTKDYSTAEAQGPQDGIGNIVLVEYGAYLLSQTLPQFGDVNSYQSTGTVSTMSDCRLPTTCPTWPNGPFDLSFVVTRYYGGSDCNPWFPLYCNSVTSINSLSDFQHVRFPVQLPLPTPFPAGTYYTQVCLWWEVNVLRLECLDFQTYVQNPDLISPKISGTPTTFYEGRSVLTVDITSWPSGGTAPYNYTWIVPSALGCSPPKESGSGSWTCTQAVGSGTPTGTSYTLGLKVCDKMKECSTPTILIWVYAILTASIYATPLSGASPLSVSFTSTVLSGSGNYSYSWTFGDGGTSAVANPSHTYECSSGCTYLSTLTVTDLNSGETALASTTINVGFVAYAKITSQSAVQSPVTVQFSGSASGGSGNYRWSWNFGDGQGSASQNPEHTYTCLGTGVCHFTSTLTVTDYSSGAHASMSVFVDFCGSGSCGTSCVPYGTLISTPTGVAPVQSLTPGDAIWGYDTVTGRLVSNIIVGNNASTTTSLLDVNNGEIELTPTDQPIFMRNSTFHGWLWNPQDLAVGDYLFEPLSSQWVLVNSLSIVNQRVQIYDLQVNGAHDYVANNFLLLDKITALTSTKLLASPSSIDIGQAVLFTFQGMNPDSTIYWYDLPTGCVGYNSTFLSCVPTGAGSFQVNASAVSPDGLTLGSASLQYTVFPNLAVQTPTGNPLSGHMDAGQTITFSVNVVGGAGGYQFDWLGLPPSCFPLDSAVITCSPTLAGSYTISASVTDANSVTVGSLSTSYTVDSDPTILALWEQQGSIVLGQSVNLIASIMGGSGSYVYTWSGLPAGCSPTNSYQVQCTPTIPGTYDVGINVTDSNGFNARGLHSVFTVFMESALILINMTGTPKNSVNVVLTDNGSIVVNESLTRTSGPPNDLALSDLVFKVGHTYYLVLTYGPATKNGHPHGDNPVFINVTFGGCTAGSTELSHDFNAEHPATYTWRINLTQVFGCREPTSPPPSPPTPPPKGTPPGTTSSGQSDSSAGESALSPEMFALSTLAIATIQCVAVVLYVTRVWLPRNRYKAATALYSSKEQL